MSNYAEAIKRIEYLESNYARQEDRINTLERKYYSLCNIMDKDRELVKEAYNTFNQEQEANLKQLVKIVSELRNEVFVSINGGVSNTECEEKETTGMPEGYCYDQVTSKFTLAEHTAFEALVKEEFIELVRRGGATWNSSSPEMKEFIDIVTVGHVQQDYRAMEKRL